MSEDRVAMARRHLKEGEGHIARQEALIAKLDRDGHAKLVVQAWTLLITLETSLRLMREDLARIEKESRGSSDPIDFGPICARIPAITGFILADLGFLASRLPLL